MDSREIFWHNFRLMRPRVMGMSREQRRGLFHIVRGGPLMIGLSVAAGAICTKN